MSLTSKTWPGLTLAFDEIRIARSGDVSFFAKGEWLMTQHLNPDETMTIRDVTGTITLEAFVYT